MNLYSTKTFSLLVSGVCILLTYSVFSTAAASGNKSCTNNASIHNEKEKTVNMVWIKPGKFIMGNDKGHLHKATNRFEPYTEEKRAHEVTVDGFWIDRYEVTNQQFSRFVKATGYVTVAEQKPKKEWFPPGVLEQDMVAGSAVFVQPTIITNSHEFTQWWHFVAGANWRQPNGPGSDINDKMNHPVVHVTHEDATAFAKWSGKQLPSEAQWEYAARGGLSEQPYSWGKDYKPSNEWMANTWQGKFPTKNSPEDGYDGTAPVGCFPENGYGLFDMAGNVWEIVNDRYRPIHKNVRTKNPTGPSNDLDNNTPLTAKHVIKGGSYLCTPTYCMRYRPSARQPQDYTMGTSHIGFRTIRQ